jgi:hypothetical protein
MGTGLELTLTTRESAALTPFNNGDSQSTNR